MTSLFIFFAIPLATIILSIVLQKALRNPILVALTFFSIFLIVAFILDLLGIVDLGTGLIAAIIYTIIAFITAFLICRFCNNNNNSDEDDEDNNCLNCGCNRELQANSNINLDVVNQNMLNNSIRSSRRIYGRRRF